MGKTKIDELVDALGGMNVERCADMRSLTTFHIGGRADALLRPVSEEQIVSAMALCEKIGLPCYVMGKGSNILVRDEGLRGLVIIIGAGMDTLKQSGTMFTAGAGLTLNALARETLSCGMQGLEWACGIPGSVGGACAMNAGAYGGEIADTLRYVRVIENGVVKELEVKKGDMAYRESAFAYPDRIVLGAVFELSPDDGRANERLSEYMARRKEKQPLREHSAGSVFKRPKGHFAGALIEGAGLKGMTVGGAKVSEKHAGFIVNTGDATASDVLSLIGIIQSGVFSAYGVSLECELKVW